VNKWDEAIYQKIFGRDRSTTRAEHVALFERTRSRHGACRPGAYSRTDAKHKFRLACDHGGDVAITFALDPSDDESVSGFAFAPADGGKCPTR
jgi:hypothetical protein